LPHARNDKQGDSLTRDIVVLETLDALSETAGAEIVRIARESIAARGRFTVALAGGNTPKVTYELLATRFRDDIDWTRVVIVFGDERFVPPDDTRSNYRMAREALLSRVPIPADSIHAVPTDDPSVSDSARAYDATLRRVLVSVPDAATVDLALLGVGPDGHTASLFPGMPALEDDSRWALPVGVPTTVQPAVERVSVSLPFLNAARIAMFLVAGKDKRPVVAEILEAAPSARRYPAALVVARERTMWLIARSAMPDDPPNA
jgi:6-phosphogluconolactonase